MSISININGEHYTGLSPDLHVLALLEYLQLSPRKIAVEINREIVPKSQYESIRLRQGDVVEIITFIGGG